MHNDILTIGPLTVHGYGLMIGIGVLCALLIGSYRAKKKGLSEDVVFSVVLCGVIFGFLGAKLLYVFSNFKHFLKDPFEILLSGSGFIVYGGIIFGVISCIIYCKIKKVSFSKYFDLLMPSVAIAQGFGRIGCFLAGCCYGRPTDSIFGVVFPPSSLAESGIKLIPTQLMSSGGNFIIALLLILYAKKTRKTGRVAALYLILYGIGRFIIEFFRHDFLIKSSVLTTAQLMSIGSIILGLALFFMYKVPFINERINSVKTQDEEVVEENK